jgi:hypothetical protein
MSLMSAQPLPDRPAQQHTMRRTGTPRKSGDRIRFPAMHLLRIQGPARDQGTAGAYLDARLRFSTLPMSGRSEISRSEHYWIYRLYPPNTISAGT